MKAQLPPDPAEAMSIELQDDGFMHPGGFEGLDGHVREPAVMREYGVGAAAQGDGRLLGRP